MTLVYYFGDIQKVPDTEIQHIQHQDSTYKLHRVVIDKVLLSDDPSPPLTLPSQTQPTSRLTTEDKLKQQPFIDRISIGYTHTIFVDSNDNIYGYGSTQAGQLGQVKLDNKNKSSDKKSQQDKYQYNTNNYRMSVTMLKQPSSKPYGYQPSSQPPSKITNVTSGTNETLLSLSNGSTYTWGTPDQFISISEHTSTNLKLDPSEFNIRQVTKRLIKTQLDLSTLSNHTLYMNSHQQSILMIDDKCYAQDGSNYQLAKGQQQTDWKTHYQELERLSLQGRSFKSIPCLSNLSITGMSLGHHHLVAWSHSGSLYGWGDNTQGQLGQQHSLSPYSPHYSSPVQINSIKPHYVYQAALGHTYTLILNSQGELITLGNVALLKTPYEIQDPTQRTLYKKSQELSDNSIPYLHSTIKQKIVKVKSGGNHHAALTYNGHVYVWGIGVNNSNLNMTHDKVGSRQPIPNDNDPQRLIVSGSTDYQRTPQLITILDRLQVVEMELGENQTILSCLIRETDRQGRKRTKQERQSSPAKKKAKVQQLYYTGRYLQQFQDVTQSLILNKIKVFKRQQENIELAEDKDDTSMTKKPVVQLELSAINNKQPLDKIYMDVVKQSSNQGLLGSSLDKSNSITQDHMLTSRQDTNLIIQYLNQNKSILNNDFIHDNKNNKSSIKEQFSGFIDILKNETTKYDKQNKKTLNSIFNNSVTSDRNVSLVFDHVNTKISKKKLESLDNKIQPVSSETQLQEPSKNKQKLPYVKDRIQQYLNNLIKTENQEYKYDYVQMVKDSRQDDILAFIFSEPQVNDIKKKNSRLQALEQKQKVTDLYTAAERFRMREVEAMRVQSQQQLQKVLSSSNIQQIKELKKNIGDSVSYIGMRKELLDFIRDRREDEKEDEQSVLNNLYQSSEYYKLKKNSNLEQQKELRDFRTNKYYNNRRLNQLQSLEHYEESGSLLVKYQKRLQRQKKQEGNVCCVTFNSVIKILELINVIKNHGNKKQNRMIKITNKVIFIQKRLRQRSLARQFKKITIQQIVLLKLFLIKLRNHSKQKRETRLIYKINIQLIKHKMRYSIKLQLYKQQQSVLRLQRMCRWINYMNNVSILRLADSFDQNLISLSLQVTKNIKGNQILKTQYNRIRDSLSNRFKYISLKSYINKCKLTSLQSTQIKDTPIQYTCYQSSESSSKMIKNLSALQETLLVYTSCNPIRENEQSPVVYMPQNLQIYQDTLKDDIYKQSLAIEAECKFKILNSMYTSLVEDQKQRFSLYLQQMHMFVRVNSKRVDLERTKMMLKSSCKQLISIESRERYKRQQNPHIQQNNKAMTCEDHLPFASMKFKIAAQFKDAPQFQPINFKIDYDSFKKQTIIEYQRLYKEKFSQNYHTYKQGIILRQLNKI